MPMNAMNAEAMTKLVWCKKLMRRTRIRRDSNLQRSVCDGGLDRQKGYV
jgi:hypothetical protein